MTLQSIEQLTPVLELLQQPAFCIANYGTVFCNPPARLLAPISAQDLFLWLGDASETYEQWDRSGDLVLPISIGSHTVHATARPLTDGTLFLLSPCDALSAGSNELTVTAQVLRQPLTDLCSITQQLSEILEEMENPLLQQQTAAISRHIYRISRITCDLADLEQLRSGNYPVNAEKLDLTSFLQDLSRELQDLCNVAGYRLEIRLPDTQIMVQADRILLERALLNLLSNALKYGDKSAPVRIFIDLTVNSVHLRLQNACIGSNSDLLTAAFQRLTQRGLLPDPQWGIGLGLPLALSIARTMGGTIAVDSHDDQVTVSMSISRKRSLQDTGVRTVPSYDYTGGLRRSLVELSDILPNDCYDSTVI